jgi:hypothetical protein
MPGKINQLLIGALFTTKKVALNFDKDVVRPERVDQKLRAIRRIPGSAGCQPAPSGSLPDGIASLP